jgi:nucleotide-binding universal stress UspA family protein
LNIDTDIVVLTARDIVAAICHQAELFGAHVICVGTQGENGFAASLLGSVAQGVAARSHRPVLLVPHLSE